MVKVTLKDGKILEFEKGIKVSEIAFNISPSLRKKALGAKINGERAELMAVVNEDCDLEILTFEDEMKRVLRHTASHILLKS
jgi:threonyl-tRNA synthetase